MVFDNKVFVSASYRTGSALVEVRPDFTHRVVWTTQEFGLHFNTRDPPGRVPVRVRRAERAGRLAGLRGRGNRESGVAGDAGMDGDDWTAAAAESLGTYRGSLLAADGQFLCLGELGHLLWMDLTPKGYKEVSRAWLFAARESWALPVLSRGLLYVTQNTRDTLHGTAPRLLCYD